MIEAHFCSRRFLLFLLIAIAGCSSSQGGEGPHDAVLVPAIPNGAQGTSTNTSTSTTGTGVGSSPLAGGLVSIGEPSRAQYCSGQGASIGLRLGGAPTLSTAGDRCQTSLAGRLFQYGLCSCNEATFAGAFEIDALDSNAGTQAGGRALGASIGINGQLLNAGVLDIDGSLIAAGGGLMPIASGSYTISGDYRAKGDLVAAGANIDFGRDLWVDGDILGLGLVNVRGDVHQTPGHAQSGMSVGGRTLTEAFSVDAPCACGADQILDIDAIVAAGSANSHNRDLGWSDTTLFNIGVGNSVDLECGRFAFSGGYLVGDTHITVRGRTALFIDGDLVIAGNYGIDLADSGELDVFVSGNLVLTGAGEIGSRARPAALRFYVGGSGEIAIAGANRFAANLYAPRADVLVAGADDIYGSFFVGSYSAAGAQRMHYDAAVLAGGADATCKNNSPL